MVDNIIGIGSQKEIITNMAAISTQLDSIEEKLDTSIEDRKTAIRDHENRLRLLEQKVCPAHSDLEERIRDITKVLNDFKVDLEVNKTKLMIIIFLATLLASGIVDGLTKLLFGS